MLKLHITQPQLIDAQQNYAALDAIPAMQRRRLSALAKMALSSALTSLNGQHVDYIVWVSRFGDEQKTLDILQDVLQQQTPSPTQFSTSVHNAIAGLYSILCQDATPSTSLSCEWTEALIEAYAILKSTTTAQRVLVVAYDQALPSVYADTVEFPAFALATVVSLENPNLEVLQLNGSESLESLTFYQFWQAAEIGQSVLRWKKC
ncbi:beta-ketoacyl synthase chain length factor [Acinetobacter sp. NIPH1876]|uniref:beta-ketoacyl synthase chain length factor n=1 Tax=Acinetobacter TaxID=469 RepID=UPI001F4B4063|nr:MULTISPECIES: beta-ketoacyl synthase chain length factor [Acinetobacter]MCH7318002.1 beta-ketoacyl synthase chain length factor [Acinetobacter higginsii]MCH7339229.1 beta-ketoacyl synthase chain length factor [Acinetobacter higginsii]MCJ0830095.1 beta-ketoacyl synthase chain length factor [Acinetobacter sp. NIPH1876]